MEPDHLKSTPPDEAQLDAWLRANATLPPLPDDGFSHRMLAALPAPQRSTGVSPRLLAIGIGAAVGIGVATVKFASGAPVEFNLPAVPEFTGTLAELADPKLHVALGVTVATLVVAFWRDLRRRVGL